MKKYLNEKGDEIKPFPNYPCDVCCCVDQSVASQLGEVCRKLFTPRFTARKTCLGGGGGAEYIRYMCNVYIYISFYSVFQMVGSLFAIKLFCESDC